jgi:hypothetical protein
MPAIIAAPNAMYKRSMVKRYPKAILARRNKIANPKKLSSTALVFGIIF